MEDQYTTPSSSQNPITGDWIATKASNEAYRSGWERIFGKKDIKEDTPQPDPHQEEAD